MTIDINTLVAEYVKRRDLLKQMEAEHEARCEPVKGELELIGAAIQKVLQAQGLKSAKTPSGTAYLSTVVSAKVEDWQAVLDYIKANDAYHLLEKRVSKTALAETGETVPGVVLSSTVNVNVRRS